VFTIPDISNLLESYKDLENLLEDNQGDPANLLMAFPLGKAGESEALVRIKYGELTAFCPWTRFPDQGSIHVTYGPNETLLELKSFKYYLLSFREEHITQEHLAQKVYHDLYEVLQPRSLEVTLDYMPRGGLHTVFTVR